MRCANTEALDAYLGEQDDAQAWTDMQVEIEDAILAAEGEVSKEGTISWLSDPEEFAELVEAIKVHRASGARGTTHDFQPDSCWWEHVHGAIDDRASEHE